MYSEPSNYYYILGRSFWMLRLFLKVHWSKYCGKNAPFLLLLLVLYSYKLLKMYTVNRKSSSTSASATTKRVYNRLRELWKAETLGGENRLTSKKIATTLLSYFERCYYGIFVSRLWVSCRLSGNDGGVYTIEIKSTGQIYLNQQVPFQLKSMLHYSQFIMI